MKTVDNEIAAGKLWEAHDWLVFVDELLRGAQSEALWDFSLWDYLGCAPLALEYGYKLLTELTGARICDRDGRVIKRFDDPSKNLIAKDDPRSQRLLGLLDQLAEIERTRPPDVRAKIGLICEQLREISGSLGLSYPGPMEWCP